ncbi:MAG: nuclease-related domain-containing protein [Acidimicrobiales bacterium]
MDLQDRVKDARRRRELSAPGRTGRYARRQVWEQQRSYARRAWWVLAAMGFLMPMLSVPLALQFVGWPRGAILGFAAASGIWLAVLEVVIHAGAASKLMGIVGEEDTARDLAALTKRGWRTVHGLKLSAADIDHVAVGPPGVLVIETKWSGTVWPADLKPANTFVGSTVDRGIRQVRGNARDVKSLVGEAIGDAPIRAVLVLRTSAAPQDDSLDWVEVAGVTVVRGQAFAQWLDTVVGEALDPDDIRQLWNALETQARTNDEEAAVDDGMPLPTLGQLLSRYGVQVPVGAGCALYSLVGFSKVLSGFALLLGPLAGTAGGLFAKRVRGLRGVALGWTATLVVIEIILVGAAVVILVRRGSLG